MYVLWPNIHAQTANSRPYYPRSRRKDVWTNVATACQRCNHAKGAKTPEEANMPLLAVPFRPNVYERFYLMNRRILADQMAFLEGHFSHQRNWTCHE